MVAVRSRVGADVVRGFSLPATFIGSACGARTTLTLRADGIGFERDVARGRELANGSSRFALDLARRRLIFANRYFKQGPFYAIVDERTLQRLGPEGGSPDSQCDERLYRSARIVRISGVLQPVTLYSDVWTQETLAGSTLNPEIVPPRFTFSSPTRTIAGFTACGRFSGAYALHGTTLHFFRLVEVDARCPVAARRMSNAFLNALKSTTAFHLCCMTLELRDAGRSVATFRTTRTP
jgi:heat shock protein HslJ